MPQDTAISLVDLDLLMAELGASDDDYVRIERLANSASARILRACNRVIKAREVTLTLDGDGGALLDLGAPIVSVTSVTMDGQALVAGTPTDPQDYLIHKARGQLVRQGGWNEGVGNITVVTTIGEETVPHDLQQAAHLLVRHWHQTTDSDLQSERIGDYSFSRFAPGIGQAGDLPPDVQSLIEPYRRWTFG